MLHCSSGVVFLEPLLGSTKPGGGGGGCGGGGVLFLSRIVGSVRLPCTQQRRGSCVMVMVGTSISCACCWRHEPPSHVRLGQRRACSSLWKLNRRLHLQVSPPSGRLLPPAGIYLSKLDSVLHIQHAELCSQDQVSPCRGWLRFLVMMHDFLFLGCSWYVRT